MVTEDENQTEQEETVRKLTLPRKAPFWTREAKRRRDLQKPRGGDRLSETGTTQACPAGVSRRHGSGEGRQLLLERPAEKQMEGEIPLFSILFSSLLLVLPIVKSIWKPAKAGA